MLQANIVFKDFFMVKEIYKKIKKLRLEKGLSQEFMAAKLSLSRPTYVQIEKGERDITLAEAQTIAALFGLSFEEFLAGKTAPDYDFVIEETKDREKSMVRSDFRISVPQEKVEKFREALIYILQKIGCKPNVGMTVIYKILYFIDFDYYEKYEEQLLGATYIKNHFGPTPLMFAKIFKEMKESNEVEEVKSKFFKHDQTKFFVNPQREPDLSVFSAQEIKHIDEELERLSDKTATELSDFSHQDVPWITAEDGKPIDYESVFYRTAETSVRKYDQD